MAIQKHTFETQVSQVLDLVIHSLYSNKEIFLRELISNASDACDKLSFLALKDNSIYKGDGDLSINISFDKTEKTLIIEDNGIGMTKDEVISNLGTIAKSGTKEFLEKIKEAQNQSNLIGQFGVGFYSAFIVASKVVVETKSINEDATMWSSDGKNEYLLGDSDKKTRGTKIVLSLKDDTFANEHTIKNIVAKYSDNIKWPIKLTTLKDGALETSPINKANAIWALSKSDITDEDYQSFYKQISNDYQDCLTWTHNKIEGKTEYTVLLYVPKTAPMYMFHKEQEHGLQLFVKRVFIMSNASIIPMYLRFIKGVVDSASLPLNISREILQSDNEQVSSLKAAVVKRVLLMLKKLAKNEENYLSFWNQFGQVLKEGVVEDITNQQEIAKLLRFYSVKKEKLISFDEYIANMQEDQKHINILTSNSLASAKNSPHLESYDKEDVLLYADKIDEWVANHLQKFGDYEIKSITKDEQEAVKDDSLDVLKFLNEQLEGKIKFAKKSSRLKNSASCILMPKNSMNLQMQRMMEAAGQKFPKELPILEVNLEHKLIEKLSKENSKELANVIFELAILADGEPLNDSSEFIKSINKLLLDNG